MKSIRVESLPDEHSMLFEQYESSDSPELIKKKLNALTEYLKADPQYEAWLISYAGRLACKPEAKQRASAVRQYLLRKGIAPARIRIVNGGFREEWLVELWLNIRGMSGPAPRPTLKPNEVRFIRRDGKRDPKCPRSYKIG
jgi:hypothetical protein